jgi:outer membrane protein
MKKLILMALIALPMSLFAQQKFAHVNSAEIIQALPEYTKAQTDLQALGKQYEDELMRMQTELQTKSEDYEKNEATLPEAVKQRRQQVPLDVADIAAALFKARDDILDMQAVDLHEALPHKRSGIRLTGNRDHLAAGR